MEMNRDSTSVMLRGQRSISTSLRARSFNPFKNSKDDVERNLSNVSAISLLELFSSKTVVPGTVKGKSRPFSSLLDSSGSIRDHSREDAQTSGVIDDVVFQQFKRTNIEKDERVLSDCNYDVELFIADDNEESRKRKMLSEGAKHNVRKHVVVIGGDSKPKKKARKNVPNTNTNTKPRPIYNHYANGSGWWDCDMEGIDSEEVGFGQVWEGVGSTTFGEI